MHGCCLLPATRGKIGLSSSGEEVLQTEEKVVRGVERKRRTRTTNVVRINPSFHLYYDTIVPYISISMVNGIVLSVAYSAYGHVVQKYIILRKSLGEGKYKEKLDNIIPYPRPSNEACRGGTLLVRWDANLDMDIRICLQCIGIIEYQMSNGSRVVGDFR